jgi:hypothetical protein
MFLRITRALFLGILWLAVMGSGSPLLAEKEPLPADEASPKPPEPGVLFTGKELPVLPI